MQFLGAHSADKTKHIAIAILLSLVIAATVFVSYQISEAGGCTDTDDFCVVVGADITNVYSAIQASEASVREEEMSEMDAVMTRIGGGEKVGAEAEGVRTNSSSDRDSCPNQGSACGIGTKQ